MTRSNTPWAGGALRAIRLEKGESQVSLAARAGASQDEISRWERGSRRPTIEDLLRLADALDCSVDALLGRGTAELAEKEGA